jgi:hypothetical protein
MPFLQAGHMIENSSWVILATSDVSFFSYRVKIIRQMIYHNKNLLDCKFI